MENDVASSRAEALKLGNKYYRGGRPCKHGHVAPRYAKNTHCVECSKLASADHREANAGRVASRVRAWREANPSRAAAISRRYYEANKAEHLARVRRRQQGISERAQSWGCVPLIAEFYRAAREAGERTGIPHEVDHIIPLRGARVSGLHIASNLRVVSRAENRKKGNKHA